MKNYLKICTGIALLSFFSASYAITVNVQSTSKNIAALGFTVNGKNHGGRGSSYSASDMPKGVYSFGIRAGNSLFGKDVPCMLNNGRNSVMLKNNTNAVLEYNGSTCRLRLS